jgi:D-3-phosphoglycerate dehydrogenase
VTGVVTFVDHRFSGLAIERELLGETGAEVRDAAGLEREQVLAACADADVVVVGARFRFDEDAIGRLGRCRALVRQGIGYDNIDVAAAGRAGIAVAYVPDYCTEEVADHAIALLLTLNRQVKTFDTAVREGRWGVPPGLVVRRLSSCVLGVVGFGRIGEAVGRRAAAHGIQVLAFDPVRPVEQIAAAGATQVELVELLERSDFVSLHAPPGPDGPLLGAAEIASMRPGAMLVNVGRSALVDEPALMQALAQGRLAGAALDVTAQEPLDPSSALLDLPVIVTPHVAFYSLEAVVELRTKAADEALRALRGEPPRCRALAP